MTNRSTWFRRALPLLVGVAALAAVTGTALSAAPRRQIAPPPVARVHIGLPDAITRADAVRWVRLLEVEGDAERRVMAVVDAYLETQDAELAQIYERAHELAGRLVSFSHSPTPSAEGIEVYRNALRERRSAANRVLVLEGSLYHAVAVAAAAAEGVAEPDPSIVELIRQSRRRTMNRRLPLGLPMAGLDLREVIHFVEGDQPLSMIEGREAWLAAWAAHDVELATLQQQAVDHQLRNSLEDFEVRVQAGDDMSAVVKARTDRSVRRLKVERSILAANERWTATFADMLDEPSSRRFRAAVQAALYPALYPSKVDLEAIRERIAAPASESEAEGRDGRGSGADSVRDLRAVVEAESARLRERERVLESKVMEVAVYESAARMSPKRRTDLEAMIEALYAERRESGRRVLELCAAIPELNDDPVVVRLRAACADDAKDGDQRGIIDPTGRGITRRPWVEGVPPSPRGGDEGGSEK